MNSLKAAGLLILLLSVALGIEFYLLVEKSRQTDRLRENLTAVVEHDRQRTEQYNQLVAQISQTNETARRREAELRKELDAVQDESGEKKRLLNQKEGEYAELKKKWIEVEGIINRDLVFALDYRHFEKALTLWPEISRLLQAAGHEKKAAEFEAVLKGIKQE